MGHWFVLQRQTKPPPPVHRTTSAGPPHGRHIAIAISLPPHGNHIVATLPRLSRSVPPRQTQLLPPCHHMATTVPPHCQYAADLEAQSCVVACLQEVNRDWGSWLTDYCAATPVKVAGPSGPQHPRHLATWWEENLMIIWRPDMLQAGNKVVMQQFPKAEDAYNGYKNWRRYLRVSTILPPVCFCHPHVTPPSPGRRDCAAPPDNIAAGHHAATRPSGLRRNARPRGHHIATTPVRSSS